MTRNYPIDGHYDIDLSCSGSGWTGTFAGILRTAVADILDDGPYSPVEVTLSDGAVHTGRLSRLDANTLIIDGDVTRTLVEVDDVLRFRA